MNPPDQDQHRISQVYLRQWSFKNHKNADTLCVIKKDDPVAHHKPVSKFTAETNLFDTTLHDVGFERFFDDQSKIAETNYPRVIESLRNGVYSPETRVHLCEFMSNLFVRQRSFYNFIKWIVPRKYLLAKLLREITFVEDDVELTRAMYEEMAKDSNESLDSKVSAIITQAWKHYLHVFQIFNHVILKAPDNRYWDTTDNPVIVQGFGNDGWIIGDARIYFPVSKEFLVFMYPNASKTPHPFSEYSIDTISEITEDIHSHVLMNVILKSNSDYAILSEDIGLYNTQTGMVEKYHKSIGADVNDPSFMNWSLIGTPFAPELTDPDLEKLVSKVDSEFAAIEINVETHLEARENECIEIVNKMVQENGGRQILGWQVWKGAYLIEAEFHAVWETTEGELKDYSFKKNQATKIVFMEDPRLSYDGKQINNIRINLVKSRLVDDYIETCNQLFRLMNKGQRALLYGEELNRFLTENQKRNMQQVLNIKNGIWSLLDSGGEYESLCFCNSNRKYKNCHGTMLKDLRRLD